MNHSLPVLRWCLVLVLGLAASSHPLWSQEGGDEQAPNVVIVITDDQGYGDLGCHGNPVLKTPNLDSLYAQSVRLTDYHVAPTCAPTRAALQSGHCSNRTGVWHTIMGRSMLREGEPTLGEVFSEAGYATGMFGKWHLGDNYPFRPEDRGYTEVLRHGGGGVGQTPDYWDNAYFDGSYFHNGRAEPVKGYCSDVYFEYAQKFIETSAASGKPFLAYISTNAPHGPHHAPEEFAKPYEGQFKTREAHFYGMIANIDHNVGQLRQFLRDKYLERNTIFIFTTDNGTASGEKVFNAQMRGKKGSPYDGGHRVPFFVHWPAGKMNQARDVDPVTHAVDVLPTLMDLCRVKATRDLAHDGKSLAKLLRGESDTGGRWDDRVLITDSQRVKDPVMWKASSVMTSQWRLINGEELYDIDADPGQKRDLASAYPAQVRRLREHYQTWWEELEPSYRNATAIYLGHPQENPATLTCHDWITDASTPWNQAMVRQGKDEPKMQGYWNVQVHQDGVYQIRLRRWPKEAQTPINAGMQPGDPVTGTKAFRETPGRAFEFQTATLEIAGLKLESEIEPNAQEVVFKTKLTAGKTRLQAMFQGKDNSAGAYYVYVERLD